jgi:hypothetical protein
MNPLILNGDKNSIHLRKIDQINDNNSVNVTNNQDNISSTSTEINQIVSEEKNEGSSELNC